MQFWLGELEIIIIIKKKFKLLQWKPEGVSILNTKDSLSLFSLKSCCTVGYSNLQYLLLLPATFHLDNVREN